MLKAKSQRFHKLREGFRKAFSMEGLHGPLSEADRALLEKLADKIVSRRMTMPAMLFLRSVQPLNLIGSQAMVFLRPFLTPLFNQADYDRAAAIMERREGLAALVDAIEAAQANRDADKGESPGE